MSPHRASVCCGWAQTGRAARNRQDVPRRACATLPLAPLHAATRAATRARQWRVAWRAVLTVSGGDAFLASRVSRRALVRRVGGALPSANDEGCIAVWLCGVAVVARVALICAQRIRNRSSPFRYECRDFLYSFASPDRALSFKTKIFCIFLAAFTILHFRFFLLVLPVIKCADGGQSGLDRIHCVCFV